MAFCIAPKILKHHFSLTTSKTWISKALSFPNLTICKSRSPHMEFCSHFWSVIGPDFSVVSEMEYVMFGFTLPSRSSCFQLPLEEDNWCLGFALSWVWWNMSCMSSEIHIIVTVSRQRLSELLFYFLGRIACICMYPKDSYGFLSRSIPGGKHIFQLTPRINLTS